MYNNSNSKASELMKFILCLLVLLATMAHFPCHAAVRQSELRDFRAPVIAPREIVKGMLWIEAEGFEDYGDWRIDTQFTHKMGSAYLIAPGVGKPIGSAKTKVAIPRSGKWRLWVRTKDWLPEYSPGRFAVAVNGKESAVLGKSRLDGWRWEFGGEYSLDVGEAIIELKDLSGAFARCDALLLTTDSSYRPPSGMEEYLKERGRLTGEDTTIYDGGAFDVVVVGSGTAGMGAALSSARNGAKTMLVHDRPVLGGNSSVELGIGTDGAAGAHPNHNLNARETGICEEANLVRQRTATKSLSSAYAYLAEREKNLLIGSNQRVYAVEKTPDGKIKAVIARDTLTGKKTRFQAKIFIDCTGDGWVGVFADAQRMYGREAQSEYNEWPAPEKRDDLTMSGCLMDYYLSYRHVMRSEPVDYKVPEWANVMPQGFDRWVRSMSPTWWIEHGGRFDDLKEPERARDELIRIVFAYWGWIKHCKFPEAARNAELVSVPFMNARREGYRLVGDYVLTANDALEGKVFEDRISYGGWPLDTHDPLGIDNPRGDGYWKHHPGVPIYTIPYRCLYSKNIPNLMFAGRCQSVTHIALGSVRVEATLFTLGQAAGTAAALSTAKGLAPREYGKKHIHELQQQLLKDDQYIPGVINEDPLDHARKARVSATSTMTWRELDGNDSNFSSRQGVRHELFLNRATAFVRGDLQELAAVECRVASELDEPAELTARIYTADTLSGSAADRHLEATAHGKVAAKRDGLVAFKLEKPLKLTRRFVWIELLPKKGVYWYLSDSVISKEYARAYGGSKDWKFVPQAQYSFLTVPRMRIKLDIKPKYVIDGTARPVGDCYHGWASAPDQKLPQSIRLDLPREVAASEVRLTFDTDLTPARVAARPKTLVRNYAVYGFDGKQWFEIAKVKDNDMRLMVHSFEKRLLKSLRVDVSATWGDPSARIFEIRIY